MTERERLLSVYRGKTPDRVPFFLDLSHWFYHRHKFPFDLSQQPAEPDLPLIEYHKKVDAGFYIPNLALFYDTCYPPDVVSTATKKMGPSGLEIIWRIDTPVGMIERRRRWEKKSYSWNISKWGVTTEQDLRVLKYALSRAEWIPAFDRFQRWTEAVGDCGVPYMPVGYSAMGHLLSLWMGIENTIYATVDMPNVMDETVKTINQNLLKCVDMVCKSSAEIIFMGDNFSSNIQPPRFFQRWSAPFYREAFKRIKAAGKHSSVHVDGRLRGLLREFACIGADCIDAVTPAPMGDLTPAQCREEAGAHLILSGGVPPSIWGQEASDEEFQSAVLGWIEMGKENPRLIAAAGDQVPPGAPEYRIEMMREVIEKYGRY